MRDITRDEVVSRVSKALFGARLITNVYRGAVFEALVDLCLSRHGWRWVAHDWAAYDFEHKSGLRLECKPSASLQTWGCKESKPSFGIAKQDYEWIADHGWQPVGTDRLADAYIFGHHFVTDRSAVDQADPSQWHFYVVASQSLPDAKRIGLNTVKNLSTAVSYKRFSSTGFTGMLSGLAGLRVYSRKRVSGHPPCHKLDHSGLDEGEACCGKPLEVLSQPPVYANPRKRALNDPALRQHLEPNLVAFDDLHRSRACLFDLWTLIAAIAADFLNKGKAVGELVENESCPVAILNARRMNLRV